MAMRRRVVFFQSNSGYPYQAGNRFMVYSKSSDEAFLLYGLKKIRWGSWHKPSDPVLFALPNYNHIHCIDWVNRWIYQLKVVITILSLSNRKTKKFLMERWSSRAFSNRIVLIYTILCETENSVLSYHHLWGGTIGIEVILWKICAEMSEVENKLFICYCVKDVKITLNYRNK